MPTLLRPIVHRDAYTRGVAREISAVLRDTIFAPLFFLLRDAGVPLIAADQAIGLDEFGRENSDDWVEFPPEWGSLGLARKDIPQIPAESRGALVNFLEARGVATAEEWMLPTDLRPTQSGYHAAKVEKAREHAGADRALLVSSDGFILDGHHQWAAARLDRPDQPLRVLRFDESIMRLVRAARLLPSSFRANATTSALEAALRSGKIHYSDGVFAGDFSSATTKELRELGASFDGAAGTFRLGDSLVPNALRGVLAQSAAASLAVTAGVLEVLAEIERNIGATGEVGVDLTRVLDAIVNDLGKQFVATTQSMGPKDVRLAPTIDTATRAAIDERVTKNLDLSITNFAKERIPELRARVEENAFRFGGRTDRLAKIIEAEFGVSKRKAEFLADQETGLLVSEYRATKYRQMGIEEYIWSTSGDNRVRQSHRVLNGKKFSFAVGANVSPAGKPARFCNPGQDYRCRCVPRPVVNLAKILEEEAA